MKIYTSLIDGLKTIKEEMDFKENIVNNLDFISIDTCYVTGTLEYKNEQLYTDLNIKVKIELASSRSLKPINFDLDFNLNLIFGSGTDFDYALTNEIDLKDIVFAHILLEKPLSIYLEDETPQETAKVTNPAFNQLKDWVL